MTSAIICGTCKSTGLVSVYDPAFVKAIWRGDEDKFTINGRLVWPHHVAVPCKCNLGDPYTAWMSRKGQLVRKIDRFGESRYHVRPLLVSARNGSDEVRAHVLAARPDAEDNPFNAALQEIDS